MGRRTRDATFKVEATLRLAHHYQIHHRLAVLGSI